MSNFWRYLLIILLERKDIIKNIKWLETRGWEDYAFDVSAALICNKVIAVDEYLVFYDASGCDKISNQKPDVSSIEKNKSLKFIAESIKNSSFFYDLIINLKQ